MRVAIIGAGPAGATLATLLASEGTDVTLFDDGRRPELLVGESLIPALVPILQRLGVEPDVAALGLLKPGVSFVWSPTYRFGFTFARFPPAVPACAYNVPRPQFDELLLERRDWMMQPGRVRGLKTAAQDHVERQAALRASGRRTSSRYCTALMRLLGRRGLRGVAPGTLAIR